jgi:hypothetical protein
MVLLHALEHSAELPRVSTDLDVLINARVVTTTVREFVKAVEAMGFELEGISPEGIAHRYVRQGVSIDVLAPEGLGQKTDLTTTPPGRTLQVPGGTQALQRTELLPVQTTTRKGVIPRPSLLGAIVTKAQAVAVDDAPDAQRLDLAVLLSLVEDPVTLSKEMTRKDRKRVRARVEMADAALPMWAELPTDAADRGLATYRLLAAET